MVLDGRLHGARAVDHDDAEADERDDDRGEHGVDGPRAPRGARLGVERRRELDADRAADVAQAATNHRAARFLVTRRLRGARTARDELVAAVLVVAEHVEAGAGGREEHGVAGQRELGAAARTASSIDAARRTGTRSPMALRDGVGGFSDEDRRAALASERVDERRVVAALVAAPGDEHGLRLDEALERRHGGADVGPLRVVVEAHAARSRRRAPCGAGGPGTPASTRRDVPEADAERARRTRWPRPR